MTVLPLTHGEHSDIAYCSKILLALLNPLLDCEQLRALKLTSKEANTIVSLLSQVAKTSCYIVQDFTLSTILRAMIWFTHEYSRKDKLVDMEKCSEYESKLNSVSCELKSNIALLMEEGVLSALKPVLKLDGQEELQAAATRILWCLAHDSSVQSQILKDIDIVGALQIFHTSSSSPKLYAASHSVLWLLGLLSNGMCEYNK